MRAEREPASAEAMELSFLELERAKVDDEIAAAERQRRPAPGRAPAPPRRAHRAHRPHAVLSLRAPGGGIGRRTYVRFSVRRVRENVGMDRDLLEGWLGAGAVAGSRSAALTDRDPSTVGYWVHKYGLTANGRDKYAPRGGLSREQLEPLVNSGVTVREMAQALDRSPSTIRYWLDQAWTRAHAPPSQSRSEALEAGRHAHRTAAATARPSSSSCAADGSVHAVPMPRRSHAASPVKRDLVEEAGGAAHLRLRRCLAALQFHHLDPRKKSLRARREA